MGFTIITVYSYFHSDLEKDVETVISEMKEFILSEGCEVYKVNYIGEPVQKLMLWEQEVAIIWSGNTENIKNSYSCMVERSVLGSVVKFK